MKLRLALLFVGVLSFAPIAEARTDHRHYSGFATGHCKRASCFAKHPGGRYIYPYHYGHRR